jgi:CheY-like chemotaxis protein
MKDRVEQLEEEPSVESFEEGYGLEGRRILVAEDIEMNAEILGDILEIEGMEHERAANGKIAVDMFADSRDGHYDAILMDIRMPVMDGLTATKTIRNLPTEWTKTVPIIAMTANAFEEDIEKTREAGMNAHLSKPIEPAILFSTLAKFIM